MRAAVMTHLRCAFRSSTSRYRFGCYKASAKYAVWWQTFIKAVI